MRTTRPLIFLDPQTIRSFAGVRARIQAAVAAQPPSVTLAEALEQVRRFRAVDIKRPSAH